MEALKPAILRAVVYAATLTLGLIAAWLTARGFGIYNAVTGDLTLTLNVNVVATYIGALVAGGGLPLLATLRGWKPITPAAR